MAQCMVSGGGLPPVVMLPLVVLLATHVASGLLIPEFEYESAGLPFGADEIERDLLFDGRSWSFDGPDVLGPDGAAHGYYQSDVNLAALHPISPLPPFTLDPSYVSPAEVIPARAKRANRLRRKPTAKRASYSIYDELAEDGKEAKGEKKQTEEEKDHVEEYEARYEKFIADNFDGDGERRREKSAPQKKAPSSGGHAESDEEDEEGNDREEHGGEDAEKETDGDYKFDRFDYSSSDDYERIKAESEEQSRQLAKDPRNCRTYEKDGMVCSVCHDPASDSASESCAFATDPHHRKYAYVKERNYDSKNPKPDAETATDDDAVAEHELSEESRAEQQTDEELPPTTTSATKPRKPRPLRKPLLRATPHHLATNGGGYRYQPPVADLRSNRANMKLRSTEPSRAAVAAVATDAPNPNPPNIYVMDYDDRDDEVARVLADFKTRDWSNCHKSKRTGEDGGLTCYQCLDAAGVNHEECMYVSESRQIATGIALPPPVTTEKQRKRKKVVPLRKEALLRADSSPLDPQPAPGDGSPALEKQTVKRTVSFRSFVTGSGPARGKSSHTVAFPLASDAAERVIHYEHHVSHEVP